MKQKKIVYRNLIEENILEKLLGISNGHSIIHHGSWRAIRQALGDELDLDEWFGALEERLGMDGSLVVPTFTYCFKRSQGDYEIFDPGRSQAKIGALADAFWRHPEVIRTASPTHSFAIWGAITRDISADNSPTSPLGRGSVLDWLAYQENSYILLAGVDFSSLSFGHYLEVLASVPWVDYSPWEYMHVLPIGASVHGDQPLCEIPGCAKGFLELQKEMEQQGLIQPILINSVNFFYIPIKCLLDFGIQFFRENAFRLLCPAETCVPCDARRRKFLPV